MTLAQAAALGLIQGLTEIFPISSSAHLALAPRIFGWQDQGLAYDVALHWGTLFALLACFGRDLWTLAAKERRLFWGLAIGTVPAGLSGLFLDDYVETVFRDPQVIAVPLIAFGILLAAAERWGKQESRLEGMGLTACLWIGLAQALAVVPGVSRSGVTITAALLLGLKRPDSAKFSFLLSIPIVFGAGVLKFKDLPAAELGPAFWVGMAAAGLSGYAAIRFLMRFVQNRTLYVFAGYRVAVGLAALLLP
ncbi:MAG: undecaprenyl-diphosphate phosphatase [Elusimicrobiota bacterium]